MRGYLGSFATWVAIAAMTSILTGGCPGPVAPDDGFSNPDPGPGPGQPAEQPSDKELLTTLFVLGPNTGFVGFNGAENLDGVDLPAPIELFNSQNTVMKPRDAVIDNRGALYVINNAKGGSIAVYDDPMTATGNRAPDRLVFGGTTQLSTSPTGLAIDHENELLYVTNGMDELLVFEIAPPELFDGDIAPIRTFHVDLPLMSFNQVRFADGSLYLVDVRGGTSDIMAFDDPEALQGAVTPDRVISNVEFDNTIGIDIDDLGRMWVGVRDTGEVLMYNDATALDGAPLPDIALSIIDVAIDPKPAFATTDSEDRLYIADSNGNAILVFDEASELVGGPTAPDRVIDSTELIAPNRLVVFEE